MKLTDTTNPVCNARTRTVLSSDSVRHQLDLLSRLHFRMIGIYSTEVGSEWSSNGKLESDYMHHIDIALTGQREVVFQGEVVQIKQGQAYWFPGNTPLERRCRERCKVVFVKLRCEWLPGVDPLLDWSGRRPCAIGPCDLEYWRALWNTDFHPSTNQLLQLQARITDWIAGVIPDISQIIANHLQTHAEFQEVFALTEHKLGADLRVAALARAHGTSLHAFSMAFRRSTGLSPKAYLERRLNQEAIQMVTNTDLKIKQIADRLRFGDEYHFSRFFRKANGVPPGRYRKSFIRR